ncbi:MvdC/MvdD family ATP grasp protein [Gordonia alkanivorans]|uniref:MvdC/MvdD family ATP grasp protein n=1 Tax=Gordonia alkanivorans TaxID=84096 RepID=UPI001F4E4E24|nr:hypothetical protein [Gordonia alkanivorans]
MGKPIVLVPTVAADTHLNLVGRYLGEHDVELVRLNTEDLYSNTEIAIEPAAGTGCVSVLDSGRSFRLEDVKAVWYRKPDTPSIEHLEIAGEQERRFFTAESYENLLSFYSVLQDRPWINNPLTTRLAHRRFHQLKVANQLGMRTVRSIFSNSESAVRKFAADIGRDLALKSLSALSVSNPVDGSVVEQYGVLTRTISAEELDMLSENVAIFPTFLQEYIDKAYDLRIVCVGREVFACRIHSQDNPVTRHDFRISTKTAEHESVDLDEEFRARLHRFMDVLGIDFGCFDFLEVAAGEPYFLECNPNGQWLWVEDRTGAPISRAVARHLAQLVR